MNSAALGGGFRLLVASAAGSAVVAAAVVATIGSVGGRFLLSAALVGIVVIAFLRSTTAGCIAALTILQLEGLLRRLADLAYAPANDVDPILLSVPLAVALILARRAIRQGSIPTVHGRLFWPQVALLATLLVGTVNVQAGSLITSAQALVVTATPLAFYALSRGSQLNFNAVLSTYSATGVAIAVYGLWQSAAGLPVWDEVWVESSGYASLVVNGGTRSFGTSASGQEYVIVLACSAAILVAQCTVRSAPLRLPALLLCAWAIFLSGSRGGLLTAAVAVVAALALRLARNAVLALVLTLAALSLSPVLLPVLGSLASAAGAPSDVVDRQLNGLTDPLNSDVSTGGLHFDLIAQNVASAFVSPLGHGLAAARLLGDRNDISVMSYGMGLLGLSAFLFLLYTTVRLMLRKGPAGRGYQVNSASAIAVLLAASLAWLNGTLYAVAPLCWICLSAIDAVADQFGAPVTRSAATMHERTT